MSARVNKPVLGGRWLWGSRGRSCGSRRITRWRAWDTNTVVGVSPYARAVLLNSRIPFDELSLREGAVCTGNLVTVIALDGLVEGSA